MSNEQPIAIGGVMRCCIETLREKMPDAPPAEGTVIECNWCRDGLEWVGDKWQARWINHGFRKEDE